MLDIDAIPEIVKTFSEEKNLEPEVIFKVLEAALAAAARRRSNEEIDVRVEIDRDTGDYRVFRRWSVVANETELEYPEMQMTLEQAQRFAGEIEFSGEIDVGSFVEQEIPKIEKDRIAAQAFKQVVQQKIREAERERVVEMYRPQINMMLFGTVKRMERGDAIIEVENAETKGSEAILFRNRMIPKDNLRTGDRLHAILRDVREEARGPQLVLDRMCPELLIELFKLEVPETKEGVVRICNAARDPGERSKISVHSDDPRVDPIGACVGIRGTRVQAVSNEIAGERVDIIRWSPNSVQYVVNALAPADVISIVIEEKEKSMDVVVSDSQLSQAIGRSGQNVRLASQLTEWNLNILTREQREEKNQQEAKEHAEKLCGQLNVDTAVASVLVENGFKTLEDIVDDPDQKLPTINEFDKDLIDNIQVRAQDALLEEEFSIYEEESSKVPDESLLNMDKMDEETAWVLAANGICTMNDLAECSVFDLEEIPDLNKSKEEIEELIMIARAPWFEALENQEESG